MYEITNLIMFFSLLIDQPSYMYRSIAWEPSFCRKSEVGVLAEFRLSHLEIRLPISMVRYFRAQWNQGRRHKEAGWASAHPEKSGKF